VTDVKLAVVGSTRFPSRAAREHAEHLINRAIDKLDPCLIVSGGAPGVDTLAERIAIVRGIPRSIHRPEHRRWKPDGFEARNRLIAEECTHLLRISSRTSLTYGSGWTANYAEKIGRVVSRHTL
jgi:predicted Rossmann fold nucleotide-binding protein DprA/Smf involved in DNA uptake